MVQEYPRGSYAAFSIFMPTLCQGTVPAWYDDKDLPVVYRTELEAQREIAEHHLELINQFLNGERDFDDAITVEDFILPITAWPDGSISIEDGRRFGKRT